MDNNILQVKIMKKLSRNNRIALYMYYYEGYTAKEIGGILHLSAGNVRMRLARAREMLKDRAWMLNDDKPLLRVQDGMIDYKGIQVPVRPMIGVIGVAPAGEPVSTMTPMDHRRVRRHAGRGVRQGIAADVPLPDRETGSGKG